MRSLGWALIQRDCCPYKQGKFGHRETRTEVRKHEDIQGEDGHLQAKERSLEQSLPSPSEGFTPANTLISVFQSPEW